MNDFTLLEQKINRLCEQTGVTGIAVAVIKDAQIAYTYAIGALANDFPIPVASLSKPVFAYAILKLCQQGTLDLLTPLAEYLPELYLDNEPYLSCMTARHALSHTTGFPNWRAASGLRAEFQPGSAFHYSTEGLIYLQTAVETLTGMPVDIFLKTEIFEPFGMQDSQLVPEDLSAFLHFLPPGLRAFGALSLQTTVLDYARFLVEMLATDNAVERPGNQYRLSQASLTQMLTPQVQVGDQRGLSWGLGWGLQDIDGMKNVFWHWGARRNLTRCFAVGHRDSRSGMVIFTDHVDGLAICEEIVQIGLTWPEPLPAFRWLLPAEKWRADGSG
jgi:CubicO group peptidase (beta-lactamase class C family)